MDVNYKNQKRYKTAKYPIRQPWYLTWLIWILSKIMLMNKKYKAEKINMDGIKPPYMLLSNHMSFIDFELTAMLTHPHKVNNVVNIDGYYHRPWLMTWIGAICTRKFTNDMHLIKSIKRVLQRGDILCMYPEARYSPCGTTSYLPDSLGMIVKMNKVPVVAVVHRGNYLHAPFWNFRKKRKVPLHTTMTCIMTADEVAQLTVEEINAKIREALEYNEYKYQLDNGIKITEPYRGTLTAENGETEFSHVPDWFEWEREQVRRQIVEGTYYFEDEVDVHSMPRCWKFEPLGKATLTHDMENGFVLKGHYNGQDYRIQRLPLQTNSLHVEYDFPHIKPFDCVDISTENDSFYCFPTKQNVVTKLSLATEEIYTVRRASVRKNRT